MAIEFDLDLSSGVEPTQALEMLSSHIGGLVLTWNGVNSDYLRGSTIEINVAEPIRSWPEIIREGFGFVPTLVVRFRFKLRAETDYDTNRQIMFRATMYMLEHAQDAVLLANGETIILQRLGGKLAFNSECVVWDEEWLKSRLTIPFEYRPLPSPLL